MTRPTISPGQSVPKGMGNAFTAESDISAPPVAAPAKVVFKEEWTSTPSIVGQRHNYPESVKIVGMEAVVFDLSQADQLKAYNDLLARTALAKGDVQILVDDSHFSEKTDNWKRFVRYQTYLFKQLAPKDQS